MSYSKYYLCYLNELTFNGNLFSFIELWTILCAVFISYLMVINSKKSKSKYPKTFWRIMPCIMSELWKKKYQQTLNTAMESCFSHMASQVCYVQTYILLYLLFSRFENSSTRPLPYGYWRGRPTDLQPSYWLCTWQHTQVFFPY